jgi:hypothetical protein
MWVVRRGCELRPSQGDPLASSAHGVQKILYPHPRVAVLLTDIEANDCLIFGQTQGSAKSPTAAEKRKQDRRSRGSGVRVRDNGGAGHGWVIVGRSQDAVAGVISQIPGGQQNRDISARRIVGCRESESGKENPCE